VIDAFCARRLARFLAKTHSVPSPLTGRGDCLLWIGARDHDGYGRFWCPGFPGITGTPRPGTVLAHRWSVGFFFGPDTLRHLTADHRCRRPSCVNPLHLLPLPHAENVSKGNTLRAWPLETGDVFEALA